MHAQVVTIQYQPGKVDEAIQILRESILPETRQQAGFKGIMALADRSTDKAMAISLWQTEADAQASGASSSYLQAQLAKVASLSAKAPVIETYEVGIQEMQQDGPPTSARVLTATAQLGKMDEGMQIVRDSVLPTARQQPGFKGGLWLLDRSTGKIFAITLWETEADLKAGETSGYYQAQIAKVAHVLATQVVREVYEVSVQA